MTANCNTTSFSAYQSGDWLRIKNMFPKEFVRNNCILTISHVHLTNYAQNINKSATKQTFMEKWMRTRVTVELFPPDIFQSKNCFCLVYNDTESPATFTASFSKGILQEIKVLNVCSTEIKKKHTIMIDQFRVNHQYSLNLNFVNSPNTKRRNVLFRQFSIL